MANHKNSLQQVLEAVQRLSLAERAQLMEELTRELEAEAPITPLALSGVWEGVSLSAQEIDEARRECWASLGAVE